MAAHRIKKGLDLPITGAPTQQVSDANPSSQGAGAQVAILGADYIGMKPRLLVKVGARVLKGQQVFEDRKNDGVMFTAPGSGEVVAIHRGAMRKFLSMVIQLDGQDEAVRFSHYTGEPAAALSADAVRALMIESGAWTYLRARPYNRVPEVGSTPESIFVAAMDTEPLSGDVDVIYAGHEAAFQTGLAALRHLTDGGVYLCVGAGSKISAGSVSGISTETFSGPHPAGLAGTHMHTLKPAGRNNVQWSIGLQDTIALGYLFQTGELYTDRVVAVCGPKAKQPRLLKTRVGVQLSALLDGEIAADGDEVRVISGSVLSGRSAGSEEEGFLGARHAQVSLIREDKDRHFMGWLSPGPNNFSVKPIFLSALMPGKRFAMGTNQHGQGRAMVPIGMYEKVMPLDILPTFLLRALITGDLETAEQLGALELDEEDLALCTFVCPGKIEYGPLLAERLAQIHKEG